MKVKYLFSTDNGISFFDPQQIYSTLQITRCNGLLKTGKVKNVYTAEWVNSQKMDIIYPEQILTENVDIELSFWLSDWKNKEGSPALLAQHNDFIKTIQNGIYIKDISTNIIYRLALLNDYEPSDKRLDRPNGGNFIIGAVALKVIEVIEKTTAITFYNTAITYNNTLIVWH